MAWHLKRLHHDSVFVHERHIDRELHADRVDGAAGADHECTVEAVASEQSASTVRPGLGDLGGGEHTSVAHQPGHGFSMPYPERHPARRSRWSVATTGRTVATCDTVRRVATHDGFSLRGVAAGPVDEPILRDVTVDIPNEGITVIVGPSGSGKSTLLRLLNRLDDPVAGEILWRGQPIVGAPPGRIAPPGRHGVPASPAVRWVGARQLPCRLIRHRREPSTARARTRRTSAVLLHREAGDLSGGEAQRMCIARGLLTRPMVLLADEPTAALDGEARHTIEELARQLADEGTPLVWVSHDTATAPTARRSRVGDRRWASRRVRSSQRSRRE